MLLKNVNSTEVSLHEQVERLERELYKANQMVADLYEAYANEAKKNAELKQDLADAEWAYAAQEKHMRELEEWIEKIDKVRDKTLSDFFYVAAKNKELRDELDDKNAQLDGCEKELNRTKAELLRLRKRIGAKEVAEMESDGWFALKFNDNGKLVIDKCQI